MLHTYFFKKAQHVIQTSERIEINALRGKWSNLSKMYSDDYVIKQIIDYKITLHIAGCGLKKLLDRCPMQCPVCLNTITCRHGHTWNDSGKNLIQCDTSCITLRDEGGLRCHSRIIVVSTGTIIKFFDFFNSVELTNYYHKSCSIPRLTLLTFKEMAHEMLCKSIFKSL